MNQQEGLVMTLKSYLESLTRLERLGDYSNYKNDPDYEYEFFVLRHYVDRDGKLNRSTPLSYKMPDFSKLIPYIEQRALTTSNKILRSRYNDLLWIYKKEYDKSLLTQGNVKEKCELAIADYADLVTELILNRSDDANLFEDIQNFLYRAWHLAKQIQSPSVSSLAQLMIEVENSINDDDKIGMWGFSYDKLMRNSKINLNEEQEKSIIQRIIQRITNLNLGEFKAVEHGVRMLLEHYKDNPEEQREYLLLLEKHGSIEKGNPFQNQHYFQKLADLYGKYNFKEEKERAIISYQFFGNKAEDYLIPIEAKIEVTAEMREALGKIMAADQPEVHFSRLCCYFVSDKKSVQEKVEKEQKEFPLRQFFPNQLINAEGVATKTIDSEEDEVFHANQLDWQFKTGLLSICLEHFKDKHQLTSESLTDLIFDEELYGNFKTTLLTAIRAYFDGNYIAMSYIAVPLIENALRQLLFQFDRSIYEENKFNDFENITLTRILKSLEEYLTDDYIFHLKFALNEKAGLNLRNNLAHGLTGDLYIGKSTAMTLLHVLMLLKSLVGFPLDADRSS